MNDTYKPRVEALQYLKDHPSCCLKPIFLSSKFPISLEDNLHKSEEVVLDLLDDGAIKVEVLNEDPRLEIVFDEIFVTVPDPLPKALLIEIVNLDPDEFDEIEPNVFRLWWD